MMKKISFVLVCCTVSACQSGPVINPSLPAVSMNPGATVIAGAIDPAAADGSAATVSVDGVPLAGLLRETNLDGNGFVGASTPHPTIGHFTTAAAFSGVSSSGETSVFYAKNLTATASSYSRNGPTTLPTNGSANFTGQYWGTNIGNSMVQSSGFVIQSGDVTLDVDFAALMINGSINNVNYHHANGASPIGSTTSFTLENAPISNDGTFTGAATFSGLAVNPSVSSVGTFSGIIGGAGGTEVAGGLTVDSVLTNGTQLRLSGVFLAD